MVKKVRFDDNVQVNKMSIDLADHIKEVKSVNDIIINTDKDTSKGTPSTPPKSTGGIKNCGLWIWMGLFIFVIILMFLFYFYFKKTEI